MTTPVSGSVPRIYEQSIAAVFESRQLSHGDHIAIRTEEGALTYTQLNSAANRIAREVLRMQPGTGQPVCLFFRQKPHYLAALLAVLKIGNIPVPVDSDFPESHNRHVIQDSQASLCLTDAELVNRAMELFQTGPRLDIQNLPANISDENLSLTVPPEASAVLLYTSGSTGKPKGVLHSQRSLLHNAVRQAELIPFRPEDRISMLYSTCVMGTVRDYMNAFTIGASLHPFDIRTYGIRPLLEWIAREEITVLHTIPSFFRQLGRTSPRPEQLHSLRMVILGGEALLKTDFDIFQSHFPDNCLLFTGLGSTETGTVRLNKLDKSASLADGAVPIGYPVRDVEILLQDNAGSPVPPGEIGEMVVRSAFIADGYWKRPELNRQVFLPDLQGEGKHLFRTGDLGRFLPDGCLVHCGRIDFQVKVRGFRIELNEIESAILASGLVEDAVVVSHTIKDVENRLVAYVVPKARTGDLSGELRQVLAIELPDYMIPSLFITLEALPRTPNGKVDRLALPTPLLALETTSPPVGEVSVETEMAYIWGDILSINPPELDDDFFALGGDSLHAASLFVEIEKRFDLKLPLAVLLENNTVRKLSARLKSDSLAPKKSLVAIRSQGTRKPLFMLPGGSGDVLYLRNLANYVDADRPLYGLQAFLPDSDPYHATNMERTASAYLTEIMELQPQGPYFLAGHSFGGYVAMEMARLLIKHGREVAFLGLWDTYPPGPRRQASLPDRIMIHLENLRGLRPGQMLGYFRDHWHTLLIRSTHLAAVRTYLRWIKYTPKTAMEVARLSRYGFLPEPYPGSLFLFRVSQRPWYVRWDPMENWRKYVLGDMEIREVQGKHGNMLFEPYVQNLSQELNDCLRQVEARLLSEHRDQE